MEKRFKVAELFLAVSLTAAIGACSQPNSLSGHERGEGSATTKTKTVVTVNEGGEGGEDGHEAETHNPSSKSEGGEGGEGGEGEKSGNADVDLMTTLALMKGHLIVAQELIQAGQFEAATPHIGHPVEELYGDIEPELTAKGIAPFKPQLNKLHDLIKSDPENSGLQAAYDKSLAAIDEAIATLPADQRQSPEFVMDVIVRTLKTAAAEYEASMVDGKFVEAIKYQDSRGFVVYVNELYETIAPTMAKAHPDDHKAIADSLSQLQGNWPSAMPPETPVNSPSQVYSLVSMVELHRPQ